MIKGGSVFIRVWRGTRLTKLASLQFFPQKEEICGRRVPVDMGHLELKFKERHLLNNLNRHFDEMKEQRYQLFKDAPRWLTVVWITVYILEISIDTASAEVTVVMAVRGYSYEHISKVQWARKYGRPFSEYLAGRR